MKCVYLLFVTLLLSVQLQNVAAFAAMNNRRGTACLLRMHADDALPEVDGTPPLSRRTALRQGAAAAVAALAAPGVAVADIYDDEAKARKEKALAEAEGNKKLVPLVLFGGTALSVPFFLPNIIRLFKKYSQ